MWPRATRALHGTQQRRSEGWPCATCSARLTEAAGFSLFILILSNCASCEGNRCGAANQEQATHTQGTNGDASDGLVTRETNTSACVPTVNIEQRGTAATRWRPRMADAVGITNQGSSSCRLDVDTVRPSNLQVDVRSIQMQESRRDAGFPRARISTLKPRSPHQHQAQPRSKAPRTRGMQRHMSTVCCHTQSSLRHWPRQRDSPRSC